MADISITKSKLKTHFHYGWWKYLLALVISVFGISIVFDMTEYRPPEEKKTELYILNGYAEAETLEGVLWPLLKEACPEQELLTSMNINLLSEDIYVRMQYSTYLAAHQGDVMLMPLSEFHNLLLDEGAETIFVELSPYIESGVIQVDGIDLSTGMAKATDGTEGIYGIPADSLKGLEAYSCNPEGALLVSMSYGGNLDTAAKLIGIMMETLK
ncbi:MAG: hypothetical protein IJ719_14210 [Clostridia bacterium]|nr:hypothetical protein [Clostridia bacterium]